MPQIQSILLMPSIFNSILSVFTSPILTVNFRHQEQLTVSPFLKVSLPNSGQQKFDETKLPIEANFKNVNGKNVMVLPRCPVNFYVPSYTRNKGAEFLFNMYQTENRQEYFIADQKITVAPYIEEYKKSRNVRFEHTAMFSDDYELEYEIYVEKSRIALEKVVKEYKNQRSLKSPLRERPEEKPAAGVKKTFAAKEETPQEEKKQTDVGLPSQKESATEMTSSHNKKTESVEEETPKEDVEPTSRTYNEESSERNFEKKSSEIQQKSFTKKSNRQPSETSSKKDAVPALAVRYKAITKKQSELKMSSSQRLPQTGSVIEESGPKPAESSDGSKKEKIFMALFLALSMVFMYFAMHPNRKV